MCVEGGGAVKTGRSAMLVARSNSDIEAMRIRRPAQPKHYGAMSASLLRKAFVKNGMRYCIGAPRTASEVHFVAMQTGRSSQKREIRISMRNRVQPCRRFESRVARGKVVFSDLCLQGECAQVPHTGKRDIRCSLLVIDCLVFQLSCRRNK